MVRLTEEMVVARTRISDLTAVKKLNCWGTELTDVSILQHLKKVEVLSLSVNNIDTLADFQYCLNLQDLFVRRNNIKDLNQVCYLKNLPNLRNLWLGENPCSDGEGYRMAVLRALPNLEKLDDKIVGTDEVKNALARGRILVHPSAMDASPTRCDTPNPQEVIAEYTDEGEDDERRRYSADRQPQSYATRVGHRTAEDTYQETDRTNANNWNTSPNFQPNYSQNNHYGYENGTTRSLDNNTEAHTITVLTRSQSRSILDNSTISATNTLTNFKEYEEPTVETERTRRRRRHSSSNGEDSYEDNTRPLILTNSDSVENYSNVLEEESTATNLISPRTSHPPLNYLEERRSVDRRDVTYEQQQQQQDDIGRRSTLFESDNSATKRTNSTTAHRHNNRSNVDREECVTRERETAVTAGAGSVTAAQGWVRHSEEKCRFHYHRRPVTRNSNILSALLCLVKELDYPSLEVVEMAVRNRMDELEE